MSTSQCKQQPLGSHTFHVHRSPATSAESKLIELGFALGFDSSASIGGFCLYCLAPRDPHSSTAQFPNFFCSEQCERTSIRTALASLTVENCFCMYGRLETLLMGAEAVAV
jgi:hypothetical protein